MRQSIPVSGEQWLNQYNATAEFQTRRYELAQRQGLLMYAAAQVMDQTPGLRLEAVETTRPSVAPWAATSTVIRAEVVTPAAITQAPPEDVHTVLSRTYIYHGGPVARTGDAAVKDDDFLTRFTLTPVLWEGDKERSALPSASLSNEDEPAELPDLDKFATLLVQFAAGAGVQLPLVGDLKLFENESPKQILKRLKSKK